MHLKKIGMDLMICKVVSTAETAALINQIAMALKGGGILINEQFCHGTLYYHQSG